MELGILIWLGSIAMSGAVAVDKRRSIIGWMFMAVLFGPFALLAVALLSKRVVIGRFGDKRAKIVACPYCYGPVDRRAVACRHCQRDLPQLPTAPARGPS